jgi:hypothetical protein
MRVSERIWWLLAWLKAACTIFGPWPAFTWLARECSAPWPAAVMVGFLFWLLSLRVVDWILKPGGTLE